ncbi:hypothetical protein EV401DRAFT_1885940 [Pisolithus croceorrhizus]|nr:hypothetical protein EV401DRAFT_1885940 [Pisolithus croceorrhizus]
MCVVVLLIFVGTTLQQRNDMVQQNNEKEWAELRSHLAERTTNINILGGLALGASATFLTSHAPTDIADWNRQFPYFFIAAANYSAMLSVLSGLGLLINLNVMDLKSFEAMQKKASRPLAAAVGWIGAIWLGDEVWMKLVASVGCGAFFFVVFVFGYVLYYVTESLVAEED